ncbi:MAG TPA: LysR family transcriptional regulator [Chloroflexia bacterium]|nr:LysR family transcriptional regulator [Chloroflexia bacterium]
MINFHQLRLFCQVAQHGSFSGAAKELFISQPAISAQVRELEDNLGLKLFERSGKMLFLTEAGKLVYRYGNEIFNKSQEMEQAIADLKGLVSGRLALASSTTVGECILPKALGSFKGVYPGIEIELQISNTTQVIERICNHQMDLGFVGEIVDDPGLTVIPFYTDEIVLFVSSSHPLALRSRPGITLTELVELDLPFVMREKGSATRRCAEKALLEEGYSPTIAIEVGSNETVKRAVIADLGVGMLSSCTLLAELKAEMVKIVPVVGLRCVRQFSIIHRKDRNLSKVEKKFIEIALLATGSNNRV